jgi:hypothetical protein
MPTGRSRRARRPGGAGGRTRPWRPGPCRPRSSRPAAGSRTTWPTVPGGDRGRVHAAPALGGRQRRQSLPAAGGELGRGRVLGHQPGVEHRRRLAAQHRTGDGDPAEEDEHGRGGGGAAQPAAAAALVGDPLRQPRRRVDSNASITARSWDASSASGSLWPISRASTRRCRLARRSRSMASRNCPTTRGYALWKNAVNPSSATPAPIRSPCRPVHVLDQAPGSRSLEVGRRGYRRVTVMRWSGTLVNRVTGWPSRSPST